MNGLRDIPGVLCAGRLYCDLVFTGVAGMPKLGKETFADGLSLHAGGGAFITAATLCALGRPAALLATIPAAPFDDIVKTDIAFNQVDDSRCSPADTALDAQVTVAIGADNDRAFLSRRTGSALPDLVAGAFDGLCHLHIGELRTLQEHPDLIDFARSAGLTVSLDCGWDDSLMADVAGLSGLIGLVDVFLPNETEALRLSELGLSETAAPLSVVKCGASGARAFDGKHQCNATAAPATVLDATGAGDAFNGGFLFDWLQGRELRQCLATGNACGRAAVQARGGTGGLDLMRELAVPVPRNLAR